jgi:purine-binding chemotaxis protein CheW
MKKAEDNENNLLTINWDEINQRLAFTQASIERKLSPSEAEKRRILRARAQLLAQSRQEPAAFAEHLDILEFTLAYERYGIELSYLREVYPLKELTTLPCAPRFVLGIINVRGAIFSVIDIKKFFDLPEKGLTDLNKALIVENEHIALGILADAVHGARAVPRSEIQPSLPTLTGIGAEYLLGVAPERLVVLDIDKILSDRRIIVNEQVD